MAQIITNFNEGLLQQGTTERNSFIFADNPIVIEVDKFSSNEAEILFPRFRVDVMLYYSLDEGNLKTITFVVPIASVKDKAVLDISSAIRSVFAQYEYSSDEATDGSVEIYPYVMFDIVAKELYVDSDGVEVIMPGVKIEHLVAYNGGLSSYERWIAADNSYPSGYQTRFTTKPSGEIFFPGQLRSESYFSPPKSTNERATVRTRFFVSGENVINIDDRMFSGHKGVIYGNGELSQDTEDFTCSGFVDIHGALSLKYKNPTFFYSMKNLGMAFYDENYSYLIGYPFSSNYAEDYSWEYNSIDVPRNAHYARFTWFEDTERFGYMEIQVTERDMALDNRERKTILFVNSRGVLETVSVLSRESKEYNIESNITTLGQTPSYKPKTGLTSHKIIGDATWNISSGYVNRDWVEWFATEFLVAKKYWMMFNGRWLPVVIASSDESMLVYDNNDSSLRDILFTVRSAIDGRIG